MQYNNIPFNNNSTPFQWNQNYALPHYDIIQVKGENGANAFQMGPNSKALLLDETAAIIWFVQTDGAGYKTVTAYNIFPRKPAPTVDINDLAARIAALEDKVNVKSNSGTGNKNAKRAAAATQPADTTD